MLELWWVLRVRGKRMYENNTKQNIHLDVRWFTVQWEREYKQAAVTEVA